MKLPDFFLHKAQWVLEQPRRLSSLIKNADSKLDDSSGALGRVKSELLLFLQLCTAWVEGSYRKIPWSSLLKIVGALVYFVWVIDIIPDVLLGVGYLDDISVILWVVKSIESDLQEFRSWQESQQKPS